MNSEVMHSYRSEIQSLRDKCDELRDVDNKSETALRAIMSASLFNLMPAVPVEQHEAAIDKMGFFQKWAIKDQNHISLLDDFVVEGPQPDFAALRTASTIFCSFHLGSYRLLIPYLVRQGLSITLLIDSAVARMQTDDFHAVISAVDPQAIADGRFEIIDTAKPNLIIAMMRALRRNRCLIVFIDGNSSVNGNAATPDSMELLPFMGQQMYARKGVAFLSHLADVSVTPVMLHRGGEGDWENHLIWHAPLVPDGSERASYVTATMATLYRLLEERLPNVFEQWESWRYVEKSLAVRDAVMLAEPPCAQAIAAGGSLQLNIERYAKYQMDAEQFLLFDRSSYRSLFISASFSNFLDGYASPGSVEASLMHPSMTPAALRGLLAKGILIFNPHTASVA